MPEYVVNFKKNKQKKRITIFAEGASEVKKQLPINVEIINIERKSETNCVTLNNNRFYL